MDVIRFAGLVLREQAGSRVLLLKRRADKTFLPNCYSGIGGKFDPGETALECILRETAEECPQINLEAVTGLRERLMLTNTSHGPLHEMHWFTGTLTDELTDFTSSEGHLEWHEVARLPLPLATMSPAAFAAIPFILGLTDRDERVYEAALGWQGEVPYLNFDS